MVEFRLDEDQRQIQDMFGKFGQEELLKAARECDEKAELPEDVLNKVWELGVAATNIPEAYGGYGMERSAVTGAIMAEELAAGDVSLAIGAMSPLLMSVPILEFGTEDQKKEWLPKFCGEKFYNATAALMEPRVAFDAADLRTTVEIQSDKLVINGEKCMVPLADKAEQILVYATTAKGSGPASVEAVVVDKGATGMSVGERQMYQGLRPLPMFPVTFKDCEVPVERRLGGNSGINYMRLLNLSRATLSAMAVGVARLPRLRDQLRKRARGLRRAHRIEAGHRLHARRIGHGDRRLPAPGMARRLEARQEPGRHPRRHPGQNLHGGSDHEGR
jgi:alkylation response protein AidB-like acyl-CoA dehydrogenase